MEHIHFVGIGGAGLSAIARILIEKGFTVSGSDRQRSPATTALELAGARVMYRHDSAHIAGANRVIRSSAIPDDNPEILAALAHGIPVLKRADVLPELLRGYRVLAVAGTHGKTTTTAMLAWILETAGYHPSYIIGSTAHNLGKNARAGEGPHFVIEADEYDNMFLGIQPDIAVITNIEYDHPDVFSTPLDYQQAFQAFIERVRPGGALIVCQDDIGAVRVAGKSRPDIRRITYAIHDTDADFTARNLRAQPGQGYRCEVYRGRTWLGTLSLQVPGRHNISNALGAWAAIDALRIAEQPVVQALESFTGTERRFQIIGEARGVTVIDDYAHHPAEIRATLAAARSRFPGTRLWVVWQPHTYSRTRQLFEDYSEAFEMADRLLVTDIYAAREPEPVDGFSAQWLIAAITHPPPDYIGDLETAANVLLEQLVPGDVLLVLSAGNATQVSQQVLAGLKQLERQNHVRS